MQIIFIENSNKAPIACTSCPDPSSSPNAASGGSKATATITPIRMAEIPAVNARTPALPDARATIILSSPTFVLDAISGVSGLTVKVNPYENRNSKSYENSCEIGFQCSANQGYISKCGSKR